LGRFNEALAAYAHAKLRATRHGFSVPEALLLENVALVQLARGSYREALDGLEDSRKRYEALAMTQHLAIAEKQLADAYLELRLLPEALILFNGAIQRFAILAMQVEHAWALTQRGRTLVALARPREEVAGDLDRAWDQFKAQNATSGLATVLLARAELALVQNEPEAALVFASDAADAFSASALALGQAQADVVRGHALLQCAKVDAADELFASTLARARELQLLSIDVRCQVGLGLVAQARGEVTVAEAEFESAIAASEEQRSALPGDDFRSAFLVDQLRPYEEVLRIALGAFDRAPSSDAAARVLVQLERFRARVLGERLGETKDHSSASHANDPDLDLRARLSWLYRRRQKLIDDGEDTQSLTVETRRIENELLELARRRRLTGVTNTRSIDAIAFDPASLQSALGDGEALVEYGVIDDELFACVVTRERVALQRRLARWPDVVDAIRSARFQIETLRYGTGAVDRHLELLARRSQTAMRRVRDLVWAPLCPHLTGVNKALIVAHDQLGSLQFSALYDGENYLAETMNPALAPSATVALYGMTRQPVAAKRALVLGESSRLVHAADEAHFVADLFDDATVLVGAEANAVELRASCADADVLHLACHAEFRSDNPMFSALQLVDGPFTVQDAETLQLRQGIVVLSACETGVAVYSRGDEMIGLVRAFLVAGASRVVASLWPVDDAVTMQFMAAFYRALHSGNTPSSALRTAQLDVMRTRPHPFHWAAFTLYGGW
jgi:tetratricopeptide (TPR) repeat protein